MDFLVNFNDSNKTNNKLENKSTSERILIFIKMNARITAARLGEELSITKEGARQHLLKLEKSDLVKSESVSEGVGRPITYYSLSEKGLEKFPDSHAEVTVDLLRSVKSLLGENALDMLIADRERRTYKRYENALVGRDTLEKRLDKLSHIRTEEGYMAEWKKENGEYFLIENHCPICAAATECQGFCRAELKNFKQLIGEEFQVERVKHIISDGQRCIYKISGIK